jgi:hypothetical protein
MSNEKPEPVQPLDLASLTMDLTRSFQPAWVADAEAGPKPGAFGGNFAEEEWTGPREHRTGPRKHKGGGQKFPAAADAFRERRQKQGDRPGSGERSAHRPRDGRPGRDGRDGRRDARSGGRDRSPARTETAPVVHGWEVRFLPEEAGLDGLAKQIKQSLKAFPLFQLARLILEKPDRYRLRFVRRGGAELFRLTLDQTLWLEEKDALQHVLTHYLDRFYRRDVVVGEPPKGNFPCVAQCGMSGVLIGPPNHHDYQGKLLRLHAERFSHVPFAVFQNRVRMLRDEESIEKWRQEQSSKETFFPLPPKPKTPAETEAGSPDEAAVQAVEEAAAVEEMEAPGEGESSAVATENTPASEVPAAAGADVAAVDDSAADPATVTETAVEAPSDTVAEAEAEGESVVAPEVGETPDGAVANEAAPEAQPLARHELEKHFREHHLPRLLRPVGDRCTIPGPAGTKSAPLLVGWLRGEFEKIQRFPLPLANALSQALHNRGCQVFKAHQNITYASTVRPRYLNRQQQPTSDRLAGILDYLERNAKTPKATQWKDLLEATPVPGGGPATEENLAAREHSLAADLTWLLREGFVVDFANQGFQVTPAPRVRENVGAAASKPKGTPVATTAPAPEASTEITADSAAEAVDAAQTVEAVEAVEAAEPTSEVSSIREVEPEVDSCPTAVVETKPELVTEAGEVVPPTNKVTPEDHSSTPEPPATQS